VSEQEPTTSKIETVVCARCRWHRSQDQGTPRADCFYNHFCAHADVGREVAIDPVTGHAGFAGVNDLGTFHVTDDPFPFCGDVNDGTCELFER